MATFAIDETKIKLAWREKYVTDGANERNLDAPRGVYRGFWLYPRAAADTWLRFMLDPYFPSHCVDKDQFAVYRHTDDGTGVDGFSVSIREPIEVEIDCAAMFPPMGLPADEDWYVYIEAAYTPNVTTTASYRVEKLDPHDPASGVGYYNPDAVILGVIPMPMGATIFPDIAGWPLAGMYDRRSLPSPTARQAPADFVDGDEPWGFFDGVSKWCLGTGAEARAFAEPTVETYAGLVTVTKFQLSGTYYVGKGAAGTAAKHFRLMANTTVRNMDLYGTDGGWLYVDEVYQVGGAIVLNPGADADAEGFYTDPWVEIGFGYTADVNFTGTTRVLCYVKKTLLTLENAPAGAFPTGDIEASGHAANILARLVAGVPSALPFGSVDDQTSLLLGHVNDRIMTIHPTAAPADWVLLWRSHNVTLDANVTKATCSIYWHNTSGLAVIVGGYIEAGGATVRAGTGSGAFTVLALFLRAGTSSGAIVSASKIAASPTNWDIVTGWDATYQVGNAYSLWSGSPVRWYLDNGEDVHHQIYPMTLATDMGLYEQATSMGAIPRFRRYMSQTGTYFTSNCSWDPATGLWTRDVAGFDAIMTKISSTGFRIYKKHADDTAVPWTDDMSAVPPVGWTTEWRIGDDGGSNQASLACMKVDGSLYEVIRFGWYGVADSGATITAGCVCNFRNKRGTIPHDVSEGDDFTLDTVYENFIGGAPPNDEFDVTGGITTHILNIDEWGFRVEFSHLAGLVLGTKHWFDAQVIIET